MGPQFNPFGSPQTVIEDSVKGETDYLNRNETLENYLSLYDEPMKVGLNRVKEDIQLKDPPGSMDSIIFNDMEMGEENYSVLDNVDGDSLRSFPDSRDDSFSNTGTNDTPFQERSGEDAKRTPEMGLVLEDNFEARRNDSLLLVHSFKEGQSGPLEETLVGYLGREKEEDSPKAVEVKYLGDDGTVNYVGDAVEVRQVGQVDDLNILCDVEPFIHQKRNEFSDAHGELSQKDNPQKGNFENHPDLQSEMPYDECALTNGFFDTIENINTKVVEKYKNLKGVSESLIGVVTKSDFEHRIDELLQLSDKNSLLIEEFRKQSEECIRRCRKFETSSEQLVGECIETLANSSICYAEWVCLHARKVDPLEVVLSDVQEFVRANE
ncbi:conserved Plasmodium protein, unknown function [Plasmodium knowlesi strain H]|uniref:Uncharacterized protein n=3 Tax=Plasmodium knowlesi TaxID=5850 RepID=A0A1A7VJ52_PLAKH|nr:conserved Plasmodium protein, unknown function [Plasmodium knowlesi strain H]OTN67123.1 Uncharacterized protein PKNOH_S07461900 [Plasmodium knowlesi]CAA9988743.1 conserved Plasmodium protein, unknown function [Plasmodium knowlesi strain H]SBO21693.1 conserved Plasmodium protein, unknown function [Plasmodium knowlesi strain H]SBO22067.1 conserved Plasmodium protein, unknown function [Plasmodium knowlesi strain H]VVS78217.1 conserved Plasmodium protein, unknown function [Plasmodium knowlesi s